MSFCKLLMMGVEGGMELKNNYACPSWRMMWVLAVGQ